MKNFLKLVHFEVNRFFKVYAVIIGVTIILQLTSVFISTLSYQSLANDVINRQGVSVEQFISEYGRTSLPAMVNYGSGWAFFFFSIAFCIAALLFYSIFIWYRDWLGKNTFIYRLLMLPSARLNILLSKATTIFLLLLGLIAVQLLLIPLESGILRLMLPDELVTNMSVVTSIRSISYFSVFLPKSFIQFLIHYGLGFMSIFVLFTGILFERSFRWKGLILGLIYGAAAVLLFLVPIILWFNRYLFGTEFLIMELLVCCFITGISIWLSNYLLNKKVTV